MAKKTSAPPTSELKITADYVFTAISAWLLPGAGHWLLGYRLRGTLLAASILGLFWVGQALAVPADGVWKPMAVTRKVSPVFFACQVGNGFSTLLADSLWGKPSKGNDLWPLDRSLPRHLNLGILFTSVSGLLNYLIILHILDPRSWAQAVLDRKASPPGGRAQPGAGQPREGATT